MPAKFRSAALAAVAFCALAPASHAARVTSDAYGEPRTVQVRYDDLNLASTTGAARLARRVASAAKTVCGAFDARDLNQRRLMNTCRADTLARTQPRVETALAGARGNTALAQGGGTLSLEVGTLSLR